MLGHEFTEPCRRASDAAGDAGVRARNHRIQPIGLRVDRLCNHVGTIDDGRVAKTGAVLFWKCSIRTDAEPGIRGVNRHLREQRIDGNVVEDVGDV
jgi:hypothetical protein